MLDYYVLTLDIDWAPDFVIKKAAEYLTKKKIKATWFITHDSPEIHALSKNKLFELGIHPNFLKESSHGSNEDEVLSYVKKILPKARVMRTHALIQSNKIMGLASEKYGIDVDVSLLLPETPNLSPHRIYYYNNIGMTRIPYFWQDDREMYNPKKTWDVKNKKFNVPGLKIFDFHPIHLYLNSDSMTASKNLKQHGPLNMLANKIIDKEINNGKGTLDLFKGICDKISAQRKSFTISEIEKMWSDEKSRSR